MKKILTTLALIACVATAYGQQAKSIAAAKSAAEAAQAAADDAKKATKQATWLKLGQAMLDAYNAPAGNGWVGATDQELQIVMSGEKVRKTETVQVMNRNFSGAETAPI